MQRTEAGVTGRKTAGLEPAAPTARRVAPAVQARPKARRIPEACEALGIGRSTIYKLAKQNKLKLVRIAGRTVVPETEIERLASEGAA